MLVRLCGPLKRRKAALVSQGGLRWNGSPFSIQPPYGPTSGLASRLEVGYQGVAIWACASEKSPCVSLIPRHNFADDALGVLAERAWVVSVEDTDSPAGTGTMTLRSYNTTSDTSRTFFRPRVLFVGGLWGSSPHLRVLL